MMNTSITRVKNMKLKDKELFTDSFNICWEILKNGNYYLSNHKSNSFSDLSCTYGQSMYEAMMTVMDNIIKSNIDIALTKTEPNDSNDEVDGDSFNDCNDSLFDTNLHQQNIYEVTSHTDKTTSKKNKITDDIIYPNKKFKSISDEMDPLFITCIDIKHESFDEEVYNDQVETNSAQLLSSTSTNNSTSNVNNDEIIQSFDTESFRDETIDVDNSWKLEQSDENDDETPSQNLQKNINNSTESTRTSCRLFDLEKDISDVKKSSNKDDEKNCIDNVNDKPNEDEKKLKNIENMKPEIKITNDISFEEKQQIVLMAQENPSWSLTKLSKHFGLKHMIQKSVLKRWEKQITRGGTHRDMIGLINQWVYGKCLDYQSKNKKISNQLIKDWGSAAKKALKLDSLKFIASDAWRFTFKEKYKITGHYFDLKIEPHPQKIDTLLRVYVSPEMKLKVLKLYNENPDWSIEKLKEESGCDHIVNLKQLRDWKSLLKYNSP